MFEELNNDLFKKTLGPISKVLEDAGVDKSDIDEIILVGGSSHIPSVQSMISEYFDGKEPFQGDFEWKGYWSDIAVVWGAALQGCNATKEEC